ncbi:phage tail tube protein [Pseudomonas aeruginosa]|uniref:phage tail tube protein n=1 Tax=Pseudomonas aeruginosa TaxID=287 RepID=UPI003982E613
MPAVQTTYSANNACVDSFNLQFDNAVQTQRCIGNGNPFPGNIIPTTFTPSGSITISWSKMAYQLWKAQQTGDAISLEFTVSNADGGYRISLPEMEVNGSWPDAGAEEIVQVELNYTARRIPPTITRLPAPIVIASVTVTPDTASVAAGETADLEAEVLPAGASQTVTWSTSDAAIATVNDTGLVTGVAVGTATITATSTADPTKTDTCAITVPAPGPGRPGRVRAVRRRHRCRHGWGGLRPRRPGRGQGRAAASTRNQSRVRCPPGAPAGLPRKLHPGDLLP